MAEGGCGAAQAHRCRALPRPGGWWHIVPGQTYRACRDEAGRLIGSTLAEPEDGPVST